MCCTLQETLNGGCLHSPQLSTSVEGIGEEELTSEISLDHLDKISTLSYICSDCGKVFKSRKNLYDHKRVHKEKLKCDICSKMFSYQSTLKRHKDTIHSNQKIRFQCDNCSKTFTLKSNMEFHKKNNCSKGCVVPKSKKILPPADCGICGRHFTTKSNLKVHQNQHHTIRNKVGFMMVNSTLSKYRNPNKRTEYICYSCPVLRRYYDKSNLN